VPPSPAAPRKNLLLTGTPGIGKTTAIIRIAKALGKEGGGFYTEEVREGGERKGFRIVTIEGRTGVLAHVSLGSGPRVGRYRVNLSDLESVAVGSIYDAARSNKTVLVDEIGLMELLSPAFRTAVMAALDSPTAVVATIREKPEPFCDLIKKREDCDIIEITHANREEVPGMVLERLRKFISSRGQ